MENINSRQKLILNVLQEKGSLSRSEIIQYISGEMPSSRITIIRDLNLLQEIGVVEVRGKGKATRYTIRQKNPLLLEIDIDKYFEKDMFYRSIQKNFEKNVFTNLKELFSGQEIDLWEKGKIAFSKAKKTLNPSIFKREHERFVIELSWKSSQIEGNTYSLIETETLIKQNIRAQGHPEEEAIMILNHKKAFEVILKKKDSFKTLNFSDVVQLHQVLTKNLVASGIRTQRVRISGTEYEPLSDKHELEHVLRQTINHINNIKYPPEKALVAALMIAYIQPFFDGNKRTSRMLANALLLAYDYIPLSYRNIDVNEYRMAMVIFYETNNLFHFKRLFMSQSKFALENYFL